MSISLSRCGDIMTSDIIIQNAKKIASIYMDAYNELNNKQICFDYDIKYRQYLFQIDLLSDGLCILNKYLSDNNIENSRYRISLTFRYKDDEEEVEKYIQPNANS